MPYIERDTDQKITAIYKTKPGESKEDLLLEEVDETLHEVLEFLLPESWSLDSGKYLADTDLSMARVVEDLVSVLIEKNLIAITDLPEAAVTKMLMRRRIREKMLDIGQIVS